MAGLRVSNPRPPTRQEEGSKPGVGDAARFPIGCANRSEPCQELLQYVLQFSTNTLC